VALAKQQPAGVLNIWASVWPDRGGTDLPFSLITKQVESEQRQQSLHTDGDHNRDPENGCQFLNGVLEAFV
jgi:hypothetical protein